MNEVRDARLFWEIVAETLVLFYGFEDAEARSRVQQVQGKMTARAIARDITYHSQPLHIAAKMARVLKPITGAQLDEYDALVERLGRKHGDFGDSSKGTEQEEVQTDEKLSQYAEIEVLAR